MEGKRCSKCGQVKPASEFHVRRASRDGLSYVCKQCHQGEAKARAKGFCDVKWHPCPYCGTPMANPRRVYCGAVGCKRQFNRDRMREYFAAYRQKAGTHYQYRFKRQRKCIQCGKTWSTTNSKAKFCSNACQAACEHGPGRTPKSRRARLTLAAAKRLAKAAKGTRGTRVFVAGWCARCGTAVIGRTLGAMFFCSPACRRQERGTARRAGRGQINRQAIYRRDGFRCQIPQCLFADRRVARAEKVPHPKAAVLDHIIPPGEARRIGMTGEEINASVNLRCAHFLCNSSRRELGGNDQLALVG